jgi:hypothetical protein
MASEHIDLMMTYDLSMLWLCHELTLSKHGRVKAITLNDQISMTFNNKTLMVSGWGVNEYYRSSPILQEVQVDVISNINCHDMAATSTNFTKDNLLFFGNTTDGNITVDESC